MSPKAKTKKIKKKSNKSAETETKPRYKTILLGNAGVGKTSLKRTFLGMEFVDNYTLTIGSDYASKELGRTTLQIWDLAGQPGFQESLDNYFVDTDSAILVFDIANPKSFEAIPKWAELLTIKKRGQVPMIIVGNKSDLRLRSYDEVAYNKALEFAAEMTNNSLFEIPYFEASALTGLNVNFIFDHLIETLETINKNK